MTTAWIVTGDEARSVLLAFVASRHGIRYLGLLTSFALFTLAIRHPDWRTIVAAAAYAVLVTWPAWLRKGGE